MSLEERKEEITRLIDEVQNVAVLDIIEGELTYLIHRDTRDVTDILTSQELDELRLLAEESPEKDSISLDDFRAEMQQWRTPS